MGQGEGLGLGLGRTRIDSIVVSLSQIFRRVQFLVLSPFFFMSCSRFVRLANTLLVDEHSARDNHVLACNFAKYL